MRMQVKKQFNTEFQTSVNVDEVVDVVQLCDNCFEVTYIHDDSFVAELTEAEFNEYFA